MIRRLPHCLKMLAVWIALPAACLGLIFHFRAGLLAVCVYAFVLLFAASRAMAFLWLRPLTCERELSADVVEIGGRVGVTCRIRNRSPLPILWLYCQETLPKKMTVDGMWRRLVFIPPGRDFHLHYSLTMTRRGCHGIGPMVLESGDVFLSVLGWAGGKVAAACSVDSPEELQAAGETGILAGLRRRKKPAPPEKPRPRRPIEFGPPDPAAKKETSTNQEDCWSQRLASKGHPGLVLLFFSLAALPLFGLGLALFPEASAQRLRLAVLLFLYLWCAFSLLFLSGMNQLRAYFEQRDLSLPDSIGLTWLSVGFLVVTALMLAAVMLPQPPTLSGAYLRERVVGAYRIAEWRAGIEEGGAGGNQAKSGATQDASQTEMEWVAEHQRKRYENIDKMDDPFLSEIARTTGVEQQQKQMLTLGAAVHDSFDEIFQLIMKILAWLVIIVGVLLGLVALLAIMRQMRASLTGFRLMRSITPKKTRRKKRKKPGEAVQPVRLRLFRDPFDWAGGPGDCDRLVRYLWEALLAWCEDAGTPCPVHLTPIEFIASQPAALVGFEAQARFIAERVTWSEFSGQTDAMEHRADLHRFWNDLQAHARGPS